MMLIVLDDETWSWRHKIKDADVEQAPGGVREGELWIYKG